jgi:hypothetical protein
VQALMACFISARLLIYVVAGVRARGSRCIFFIATEYKYFGFQILFCDYRCIFITWWYYVIVGKMNRA